MTRKEQLQIKNKEREKIVKFLREHPEENKLHLDKNLLEFLLFDYNYALGFLGEQEESGFYKLPAISCENDYKKLYKNKEDIENKALLAKFPVWSGTFLRRIDLSEVDFSNVVWNPEVIEELDIIWGFPMDGYRYVTQTNKLPLGDDPETFNRNYVDYSHTNAQIDFAQSFSAKAFVDGNALYNCNFSGISLEHSNSQTISSIYNCDLSGTNFQINEDNFFAYASNFNGLSLQHIETIYSTQEEASIYFTHFFERCNVAHTGLYVHALPKNAKGNYYYDTFIEDVMHGMYDGCTLNFHYFDINDDGFDCYTNDDDDNPDMGFGLKLT